MHDCIMTEAGQNYGRLESGDLPIAVCSVPRLYSPIAFIESAIGRFCE